MLLTNKVTPQSPFVLPFAVIFLSKTTSPPDPTIISSELQSTMPSTLSGVTTI